MDDNLDPHLVPALPANGPRMACSYLSNHEAIGDRRMESVYKDGEGS